MQNRNKQRDILYLNTANSFFYKKRLDSFLFRPALLLLIVLSISFNGHSHDIIGQRIRYHLGHYLLVRNHIGIGKVTKKKNLKLKIEIEEWIKGGVKRQKFKAWHRYNFHQNGDQTDLNLDKTYLFFFRGKSENQKKILLTDHTWFEFIDADTMFIPQTFFNFRFVTEKHKELSKELKLNGMKIAKKDMIDLISFVHSMYKIRPSILKKRDRKKHPGFCYEYVQTSKKTSEFQELLIQNLIPYICK